MSEHARPPKRAARAERDQLPHRTRWAAAMLIGLAVSALLAVVLLYVPHWMLTRMPFITRDVRVALATGWIAAATVALLWAGAHFGRAPERAA